jgi:hypothetical protein
MPINPKNELHYRVVQRRLGEIQVAIRLAASLAKDDPAIPGLNKALEAMVEAKSYLMKIVIRMEAE